MDEVDKQSQQDTGSPEERNLVALRESFENELTEFRSEGNFTHPHEDLLSNENGDEYDEEEAGNNTLKSFQQQNNFGYEQEAEDEDGHTKRIQQQKSAKLILDAEVSSTTENVISDENFW